MMTTLYLLRSLFLLLSCGKCSNALSLGLSVSLLQIANLKMKCLSAFLMGGILVLLVIYAYIQLIKKEKLIQELLLNLEKQRNKQAEDEKNRVQNNLLIQSLEKRLKENTEDKELIRLRMETLEAENKYLQSPRISAIEQFKRSEVYLRFHNKQEWKVEPEDWKELFQATDSAYPRFGHRLNERLLKPTYRIVQECAYKVISIQLFLQQTTFQ